jgi:glycosyltransferase involved in cell wall biosynthesis
VMTRKAVILTEIIAPYRIPVFNALARRAELDLHVVFLAETDETLRQWRVYRDEIRFSHEVLPSWRWRAGNINVLLNRGLWPALSKARPHVLVCGGYAYAASWAAMLWARRHGVEFVLWSESNRHDARRGRAWVEWLKAYFLRHCDRFVVPGKASLEYLRLLGSPADKIVTAPNAVDNDWFAAESGNARLHSSGLREKLNLPSRFILFVGRLVPEKGIFDLLAAYAKLESGLRSGVGLVYAGDGVAREELKQRAKGVNPGNVCFPGFAQREDLAGLYGLAEALVLPTHSDPWGLVVNEAMACGLPIIVTSVAGCSADLVDDGWNGYVVPPGDPEKLSMAIRSILLEPELQMQMRARSLERIRNYSPETCADGLAAAMISAEMESR